MKIKKTKTMKNGHKYLRILILLNLNEQNDIDKIYLYTRDLNKPKYKILIKKCENAGIKHLNDPNSFIKCSNTMDDVYENIHDYNSSRKERS